MWTLPVSVSGISWWPITNTCLGTLNDDSSSLQPRAHRGGVDLLPRLRDHRGHHDLPAHRIRHADHRGQLHLGQRLERELDLARRHVRAARS